MNSLNGQIQNSVDQQHPVHMSNEEPRILAMMNNVPLSTNNEIPQEQQIAYCNIPVNYQPIYDPQPYVYSQQMPHGLIVNHDSSANLSDQNQQQEMPCGK